MIWQAAVAADLSCRLGEGPWWDAREERLIWVDLTAGAVHTLAGAGALATRRPGGQVGFLVGCSGGGFLAGSDAGLVALDADLEFVEHLATPPDLQGGGMRLNDGACDPAGRVLLGSVDPAGRRRGTLWSWSPRDGFSALVDGVGMSNGLGFSPDGSGLYFVDTRTGRVDRFTYDVENGAVGRSESVHEVPAAMGLADGLAVDCEGCVWVAIWGAGEVWRLSPEGERLGTVRAAASRTSSCCFGGRARDRLFVTSATEGGEDTPLDEGGAPGALFVAEVGIAGAPVFAAAI
jgi:sugar lactone lactonase YvrE